MWNGIPKEIEQVGRFQQLPSESSTASCLPLSDKGVIPVSSLRQAVDTIMLAGELVSPVVFVVVGKGELK